MPIGEMSKKLPFSVALAILNFDPKIGRKV